jgi:zinc transporter ZupT
MSLNSPFSRKRAGRDLVSALPAVGIVLGAILGALLGEFWTIDGGSGAIVTGAGIGIAAGLVVGLLLRELFRER